MLSKNENFLGSHVFGARLKTTQSWDDLGQVGVNHIMIDLTYDVQNTESEYKNNKVGYGLFLFMAELEIDCEISIVSPALRFT